MKWMPETNMTENLHLTQDLMSTTMLYNFSLKIEEEFFTAVWRTFTILSLALTTPECTFPQVNPDQYRCFSERYFPRG